MENLLQGRKNLTPTLSSFEEREIFLRRFFFEKKLSFEAPRFA